MSDGKMKALSVVRREEESEALAQQEESNRQLGLDNTASYKAQRASAEAVENANNLAEVGASHGYEPTQEDAKPERDKK